MSALYITHPAQLNGVRSDQTIVMHVSLIDERHPFCSMAAIKARRQAERGLTLPNQRKPLATGTARL